MKQKPTTINEYIATLPEKAGKYLKQIKSLVKKAAPGSQETISYGIPAFMLGGTYLIYFAGYKNHVSIYPAPKGNAALEKEVSTYRRGKGTLQFQLSEPLPSGLITKIIRQSIKTNKERSERKKRTTQK